MAFRPKLSMVLTAIVHALLWFRPGGEAETAIPCLRSTAEQLINEIRSSDPSFPITKGSTRQHAMAMLKDKLGDLVNADIPTMICAEKQAAGRPIISESGQEETQMKGHIRERSPGHWAIILELRDPRPANGVASGINSRAPSGRRKTSAPD